MSTFAVFGTTLTVAREQAMKKVKVVKLTPAEYEEKVQSTANDLLIKLKPKQISPAFDAPQFCNEWIAIAARSTQLGGVSIMARIKIDAKTKTGKPRQKLAWVPYTQQPQEAAA